MADRTGLTRLTPGERFWLQRTRRGETQAAAAKRLGVAERRYLQAERDRRPLPRPPRLKPTPAEQCALARRRDGRSLRELAGVLRAGSHVTLLAWERQGNPALRRAWEGLGYSFG